MTYKMVLKGGPNDGYEIISEIPPPDLVNGDGLSFQYLGPNWYQLFLVDHEGKVAYYESTQLAEFPDAEQVEEGTWRIAADGGPPIEAS